MGRVTSKAIHPLGLVGPQPGRFKAAGWLWFMEGLWVLQDGDLETAVVTICKEEGTLVKP